MASMLKTGCLIVCCFTLAGCATEWPEDTPVQCRVRSGAADLDCSVRPDGSLEDCRISRETPAECGFGPAALEAAAKARIDNPTGRTGRVNFTTKFETPRR